MLPPFLAADIGPAYRVATAEYLQSFWWAVGVAQLLGLVALILLFRSHPGRHVQIALIACLLWGWQGFVFHFAFFGATTPVAYLFGILALFAAQQLFSLGVEKTRLAFFWRGDTHAWLGLGWMLLGLVGLPVGAWLIGDTPVSSGVSLTSLALPPATILFTLGLTAQLRRPHSSGPLWAPTLLALVWGLAASSGQLLLGGLLLLAGLFGLLQLSRCRTMPPAPH